VLTLTGETIESAEDGIHAWSDFAVFVTVEVLPASEIPRCRHGIGKCV
jgi:hypothetical protein